MQSIPLFESQVDDVATVDGVHYIVTGLDVDSQMIRLAAGRTDPGTWVSPSDFDSFVIERM
jgi:hypothetical protein